MILNASKQFCHVRSAGKPPWGKRISPEAGRRKFFRKVNGILIWELEKGKKFYSLVNKFRINCIAKDSKLFLKAVSIQFSVVPSFPKENNSRQSCISQRDTWDCNSECKFNLNYGTPLFKRWRNWGLVFGGYVFRDTRVQDKKYSQIIVSSNARRKKQVSYSYISLVSKLAETSLCIP